MMIWDYIRVRSAGNIITISESHKFCVDSVTDEKIDNFSDGKFGHMTYFEKCVLKTPIAILI